MTAKCVRQRIAAVMKWAVAQGYRQDNAAGDAISASTSSNSKKHSVMCPSSASALAGLFGARPANEQTELFESVP